MFGSLVAGLLSDARAATGASGCAGATPLHQATSLQSVVPPIGERVRSLYVDPARGIGWGRIASLIATCKLNGVEPYAWLKGTLEKIAAGHPQSRVHELLPWAYSATSN